MLLLLRGLVVAVALGIWIASVVDVVRSDASAVHHLHKLVWLAFVLLIPLFGAPCWLLLGRPQPLFTRFFEAPRSAPRAPDDSPEFLAKLEDEIRRRRRAEQLRARSDETQDIDEEIRRLEDELRRRSEEDSGDDPKP